MLMPLYPAWYCMMTLFLLCHIHALVLPLIFTSVLMRFPFRGARSQKFILHVLIARLRARLSTPGGSKGGGQSGGGRQARGCYTRGKPGLLLKYFSKHLESPISPPPNTPWTFKIEKSRIRETKNLSTDIDSSTDTNKILLSRAKFAQKQFFFLRAAI